MKDSIEFLNNNFRRNKNKTINRLNEANALKHVSPKGMMKLFDDTNIRVERLFVAKNRKLLIDRYSCITDHLVFYSKYKSNIISEIENAEEMFKGIRYLTLLEAPIMNDVRITTYVDSILYTYKNGIPYLIKVKKGKYEWILFVDDLFRYEI